MLTPHALLVPTLPTLLVDEHRGHRTEMLAAIGEAAARLHADAPEAIVVVSARWRAAGPFLAGANRRHTTITDYHGFGVEVRYDCPGDPGLARAVVDTATRARVRAATSTRGVDSGVTVPMHFLVPERGRRVVPVSVSDAPAAAHRAWGDAIRRALAARPERIAFVVGGLLSNNEHAWGLRREVPESRAFDEGVLDALARGAWDDLGRRDRATLERAQPDAGLRHLEVLRGFLGGAGAGTVECYEASPGVGAALLRFDLAVPASRAADDRSSGEA